MPLIRSSNLKRGFTLVELMVTITIAGILLAIAIPNYSQWAINQQLITTSNAFNEALSRARSAAVSRNLKTYLVACNNNWASGWMVFVDVNGDGVKNPNAIDVNGDGVISSSETDVVIARYPAISSQLTVATSVPYAFQDTTVNGVMPTCDGLNGLTAINGGALYIRYNGDGSATFDGGAFISNSILFLSVNDPTNGYGVVLDTGGRARTAKLAAGYSSLSKGI